MSETSRWRAEQQSRTLQEYTNGLRGVWTDQAARTIYQRYLNPHYNEDEQMQAAYQSQDRTLRNAEQLCERAKEQRLLAEEASLRLEEHLRSTKEAMRNAEYYRARARDDEVVAQSQIQQVDNLIAQAYQIGL
jgi:hypothetical protein